MSQSRLQLRPPNLATLLELAERREEEELDILNNFENWIEEEDEEPAGQLFESLQNSPTRDWIALTNFTKEEVLDLFRDVEAVCTSERRRGPKFAVKTVDALLALLVLYKSVPKYDDLCTKICYKPTAVRNALDRMQGVLNQVLRQRWWSDRQRPQPLIDTHWPYVALLIDVNSIEVFRPTGRFEDAKTYWDAKNFMYALKFEVAVLAAEPHYGLFCFSGKVGSMHDFKVHQANCNSDVNEITTYLQKTQEELAQIPTDRNNRSWALLGDKAYDAEATYTPHERRISIKKHPTTTVESGNNAEKSRLRVPIEGFFGRMWKLWVLLRKPYPYDHTQIDQDYENMLLLTNEHIRATHPLEEQDQIFYKACREERQRRYANKAEKRKVQQTAYLNRRKRRYGAMFQVQ